MSFISELQRRNVVRVAIGYLASAWLLIEVLETLFPIFGLPETSVRVVVILLAIGFVPAMVLTWIFEWTPEGIRRDEGQALTEADATSRRRLDRIIFVVLALAVAYFSVDKFVLDPARDARQEQAAEDRGRTAAFVESYGDQSIAVLPFADLSAGGDQAYFSDGIAEEILNLLARVSELRVISRSSAFKYRGDDIHIPTVAEALNVSYVLEGSVRQAGDRIRITAQLIDARADTHVWSENYDRQLSGVFEIQDDIAASIVDELQIELLGEAPKSVRTDEETYTLYLQGHYAMMVQQDYLKANELFEKALASDPNYVPALNLMVHSVYNLIGDSGRARYTSDEAVPLMRKYIDRALIIDPENAHSNAHRGWMAYYYQNDLETAVLYLNRALKYDPNHVFVLLYSSVISYQIGRFEDAIAFGEAALAHDPLCNPCLFVLGRVYLSSGRYEKAQVASERRMQFAPGGWYTVGDSYLLRGNAEKALECYNKQKSGDTDVGWLAATAIAHYELGDEAAYDAALSELKQIDDDWAGYFIAQVYAWTGNADAAFQALNRFLDPEARSFRERFRRVVWHHLYRNLHNDPRWLELRREGGLDPERLAAIRIEVPEFKGAEPR